MIRALFLLSALALTYALLPRDVRQRLEDQAKEVSDVAVSFLLRATSQFGSELSDEGRAEQGMWREQRMRDFKELAKPS
jgi:hypothetical protein